MFETQEPPPPPLDPPPTAEASGAAAGSADPIIGEDPGSVGPMPFHEAAEGIEPEILPAEKPTGSDVPPEDREQAKLLLQSVLETWNALAPHAKSWLIRCQVFDEPQRELLSTVWAPYVAKYLAAVDAVWVAVLTTVTVCSSNIQRAAQDASSRQHPRPRGLRDEPEEHQVDDSEDEPWPSTEAIGETVIGSSPLV